MDTHTHASSSKAVVSSWGGGGGLCPFLGDSNRRKDKSERPGGVPDNLDELAHVDVVGDQELGLVQDGKLLFSFVTLNDHLWGTDRKW